MVEDPKTGDSNFEKQDHDDHNSIAYLMWTPASPENLRKIKWGHPQEEQLVIPNRGYEQLGHDVPPFEHGSEPAYIDPNVQHRV